MIEQDKGEFSQIMQGTMAMYSKDVSSALLKMWYASLIEYDIAALREAFNAWLRNPDQGQFAPKPADIIRLIDGATGDRAMLAWSKLEKAVRRVGPYSSVGFDDAIIHKVVEDLGGWIKLANTKTEKDLEFVGLDFVKRYRGYALKGVAQDYPAYLIGQAEADNVRNGFPGIDHVQLVGDAQRAADVAKIGSASATLRITTGPIGDALVAKPVGLLTDKVLGKSA